MDVGGRYVAEGEIVLSTVLFKTGWSYSTSGYVGAVEVSKLVMLTSGWVGALRNGSWEMYPPSEVLMAYL